MINYCEKDGRQRGFAPFRAIRVWPLPESVKTKIIARISLAMNLEARNGKAEPFRKKGGKAAVAMLRNKSYSRTLPPCDRY